MEKYLMQMVMGCIGAVGFAVLFNVHRSKLGIIALASAVSWMGFAVPCERAVEDLLFGESFFLDSRQSIHPYDDLPLAYLRVILRKFRIEESRLVRVGNHRSYIVATIHPCKFGTTEFGKGLFADKGSFVYQIVARFSYDLVLRDVLIVGITRGDRFDETAIRKGYLLLGDGSSKSLKL